MKVLSVPRSLRRSVALLFLTVPLAALEPLVASRSVWWNLPYPKMEFGSACAAALSVPLAIWMLRGRRWALLLTGALAAAWLLYCASSALRLHHPVLAYYTIALFLYFTALLLGINRAMTRSYFDPRLKWYQGMPKPIPGLKCELVLGEKRADFRVSRLDRDGAFLFSDRGAGQVFTWQDFERHGGRPELIFHFRENRLHCQGSPMRIMSPDRGLGAGIQFQGWQASGADMKKEIGDFVELLRGEGYVI